MPVRVMSLSDIPRKNQLGHEPIRSHLLLLIGELRMPGGGELVSGSLHGDNALARLLYSDELVRLKSGSYLRASTLKHVGRDSHSCQKVSGTDCICEWSSSLLLSLCCYTEVQASSSHTRHSIRRARRGAADIRRGKAKIPQPWSRDPARWIQAGQSSLQGSLCST